jgi:flagellar M-ring protein FliF
VVDGFKAFSLARRSWCWPASSPSRLGAFLFFSWSSTPDYSPLFSNLASKDAGAIVEKLGSRPATPYELTDGGQTSWCPRTRYTSFGCR